MMKMKKGWAVLILTAMILTALFGTAFAEDCERDGVTETFEELQSLASNMILVDVPENSVNVLYRWNKDMEEAEIYFDFEGISYQLYAMSGEQLDMVGGDFGDGNEPVETDCNLTMDASDFNAQVKGYSAENDTCYALMGPSALKGAVVMDLAKKLFPADCI